MIEEQDQYVLIMDSGAFSIRREKEGKRSKMKKEKTPFIERYLHYILENLDKIDYFVNLDVIPLDSHSSTNKSQAKVSAQESWDNYWWLVKHGKKKKKLMPVFHRDEPWYWLEKMVQEIPYIGLSPGKNRSTSQKRKWLNRAMTILCDKEGMPRVKFHGFGVASFSLLRQYSWYSIDSSTWLVITHKGAVLLPRTTNNKWDFSKTPERIGVSARTMYDRIQVAPDRLKSQFMRYINWLGYEMGESKFVEVPENYSLVPRKEIWYKKGKIVERLIKRGISNDFQQRNEMNAFFFIELEKTFPKWPWAYKHKRKGFVF